MTDSFELGPIRPPSEAYSLLIRATRNCPWNRCKFCHTYKGEKFQLRSVDEIKQDIDTARAIQDKIKESAGIPLNSSPNAACYNVALFLSADGESSFLQDANSLIMRTGKLAEVIRYLKATFPSIKRITSYGRTNTAAKKTLEELTELHQAGLSRLHIGLESGYDPLLEYMDKGVTAAEHIAGGRKVVESGISLSEYVILGLGGRDLWRQHATETARVLNKIDPGFIRVRTLSINNRMPLHKEIEAGNFIRATDEQILEEERLLIERLECHSNYVSDHITNLLQEIEGKLPEDKEKMLAAIDRFRLLPDEERLNFRVGRRLGIYTELGDLCNPPKREVVEQVVHRLKQNGNGLDESLYELMGRYI
jgi:hypothetical protein